MSSNLDFKMALVHVRNALVKLEAGFDQFSFAQEAFEDLESAKHCLRVYIEKVMELTHEQIKSDKRS